MLGAAGVVALAAGVGWATLTPRSPWGAGHVDEARWELAPFTEETVARQALQLARATVYGGSPATDLLDGAAQGPVVVCAGLAQPEPPCAWGEGETLAAAVASAAEDLRGARDDWPALEDRVLFLVDFVVDVSRRTVPDDSASPHDAGRFGWTVAGPGGRAVVLPWQELALGLVDEDSGRRDAERLRQALAFQGVELPPEPPFEAERLRTISWIERASSPTREPLRLYRLHPHEAPELTPDQLLQRGVWAADHLMASVIGSGRIRYLYTTRSGEQEHGYNMLRHAGTTYSMLQAYERTGFEPYLRASEAAIGYLLAYSRRDERHGPYGGGDVMWVAEGPDIKLGGAGLALVALSTHLQATGDERWLEEARAYARFLVSQQKETGEFVSFAPLEPGGKGRDEASAYYPGEAVLGLTLLHQLDPDPLWLDTARRGADWLIGVRDAGKGPAELANDHWLMIALSHLHRATDDPRYVEHALALAEAVGVQASRQAGHERYHRDYAGGYYEPPRSTPAATRAEGLVAVLDICHATGRSCDDVRSLLLDSVRHAVQSQYTPDVLWWMPDPSVAFGGVPGGILDPDLRNDYVQHSLSALLGAERHLRHPGGEAILPGGPAWDRPKQAEFAGVAASRLQALREATIRIRGETPWEAPPAAEADPGADLPARLRRRRSAMSPGVTK